MFVTPRKSLDRRGRTGYSETIQSQHDDAENPSTTLENPGPTKERIDRENNGPGDALDPFASNGLSRIEWTFPHRMDFPASNVDLRFLGVVASLRLSVCLSVNLSVCLSVYSSLRSSLYLSLRLSFRLVIWTSVICPCVCHFYTHFYGHLKRYNASFKFPIYVI